MGERAVAGRGVDSGLPAPPPASWAGRDSSERLHSSGSPRIAAAGGTFALHLYPQIYNHDGRHANLGWMQENPDPMTMAVWNSWVEINMQVAHSWASGPATSCG